MVCAGKYTGPAERSGAPIQRLDRRLRSVIGVDSTKGIVARDASYHDVAFQHAERAKRSHGASLWHHQTGRCTGEHNSAVARTADRPRLAAQALAPCGSSPGTLRLEPGTAALQPRRHC
jgi:hypothetical protein